jgi:hypothetical protein
VQERVIVLRVVIVEPVSTDDHVPHATLDFRAELIQSELASDVGQKFGRNGRQTQVTVEEKRIR